MFLIKNKTSNIKLVCLACGDFDSVELLKQYEKSKGRYLEKKYLVIIAIE